MRRQWVIATLVGLWWAAGPGVAQEPELSSEARVAADVLARAGWTGQASVGALSLTAREAAVFSAGAQEALAAADRLPEPQRAALADVARVTLSEPGWFFRTHLPAGTYRIGLDQQPRYRRWVLRGEGEPILAADAFWLDGRSTEPCRAAASAADGAATATLTAGGVEFHWRFVGDAAYAAATAAPTTLTVGPVVFHTDLTHAATVKALAEECAAAVPVHAALLGVPAPKEPLHVYCWVDAERFRGVDRLLTGGRFAAQGAFTTSLTGQGYVWYVPHASPIAFDDHGPTHKMRSLLLHELHHVIVHRFFKGADAWPSWLHEGLAELGTWRALERRTAADGRWFVDRARGLWHTRRAWGDVPAAENLFADTPADLVHTWYAGVFLVARALEQARPGALAGLLPYIEGEPVERRVRPRLLERIEREWKPIPQLYRDLLADVAAGAPPDVMYGQVDPVGDAWRVISPPDGQARVLLPDPVAGPNVTVSAEFAWHPVGSHQADCYLAYRAGRGVAQFLKVALLPQDITLLRWRDGFWKTWGTVHFDQALTLGEPRTPTWHPLTITLDAGARTLRVETTAGRWAQFRLEEYVPTADSRVGFGCYDGIAFFRNVRAR